MRAGKVPVRGGGGAGGGGGGGGGGGRRRRRRGGAGPPATEKLPISAMAPLKLAIMALLVCRPSLAFVVVAPPPCACGVCGISGVPAIAGTADLPRESSGSSGRRSSRRRKSLRCKFSLDVVGSGSTPEKNASLADGGLTTSSTETQNGGGGGGRGRSLHLESDMFVPPSGSASLESALTGSPHFGDIMGGVESNRGGQEGGLLHHFGAMERVVLTANGNLQRLMSSYYNSPVTVDITYCREVEPSVYEREVEISVFGRVFCIAKSLVVLHNPACVEAVKSGSVGIGQLFRSLDILPNFELLNAGHWTGSASAFKGNGSDSGSGGGGVRGRGGGKGGLWRVYDLRSRHVSCRIHEEFLPDLFDLK